MPSLKNEYFRNFSSSYTPNGMLKNDDNNVKSDVRYPVVNIIKL